LRLCVNCNHDYETYNIATSFISEHFKYEINILIIDAAGVSYYS